MPLPPPPRDPTPAAPAVPAAPAAAEGGPGGAENDEDGAFPDARLIALAKQKRERLRHASMAPDYLPSESGAFRGVAEFKRCEDALRKGSDDEGSDDEAEEHMRVRFKGELGVKGSGLDG